MKKITNVTFLILFALLILVPLSRFNTADNAISEIDNRKLADAPVSEGNMPLSPKFRIGLQDYVEDRIGLRDEMILAYTIANDKLFGEMVHPSYDYGKDGHVFPKFRSAVPTDDYLASFADLVRECKEYCSSNDIDFVFVFNPSKTSVCSDKLPAGVHFDRRWVEMLFDYLDEYNVPYIDNTELLTERYKQGENVFNTKFDVNHWTELGAFYGVNNIIDAVNDCGYDIRLNEVEDFVVEKKTEHSLLTSKFPINEEVLEYSLRNEVDDLTDDYREKIRLSERYPNFLYTKNPSLMTQNHSRIPKVLSFQGSYMNGKGRKFMENAFAEYIGIQAYENILNYREYMDMFEPEIVIFETAEFTISPNYYNIVG